MFIIENKDLPLEKVIRMYQWAGEDEVDQPFRY
jgi:exonuclease VII small subunit